MRPIIKVLITLILFFIMVFIPAKQEGVIVVVVGGYIGILLMAFSILGFLQLKREKVKQISIFQIKKRRMKWQRMELNRSFFQR